MKEIYYVIVDLHSLAYMNGGSPVKLKDADKFETLEEALKDLAKYDEDFDGEIYKIEETVYRIVKRASDIDKNI